MGSERILVEGEDGCQGRPCFGRPYYIESVKSEGRRMMPCLCITLWKIVVIWFLHHLQLLPQLVCATLFLLPNIYFTSGVSNRVVGSFSYRCAGMRSTRLRLFGVVYIYSEYGYDIR